MIHLQNTLTKSLLASFVASLTQAKVFSGQFNSLLHQIATIATILVLPFSMAGLFGMIINVLGRSDNGLVSSFGTVDVTIAVVIVPFAFLKNAILPIQI